MFEFIVSIRGVELRFAAFSFYDIIKNVNEMLLGEVSEWFKELVLKTSDPARDRGFESHLLRQPLSGYSPEPLQPKRIGG